MSHCAVTTIRSHSECGRTLGAIAVAMVPLCMTYIVDVHAQAGVTAFEVVSIKPNNSGDQRRIMSPPQPGGRFTSINVTVRQLIERAFGLQASVDGGPRWINTDGYNITAKAASDITPTALSLMLQNLLRDRFKLAAHKVTRDGQIYELSLSRRDSTLGPQMKVSSANCPVASGAGADLTQRGLLGPDGRGLGLDPPHGRESRPSNTPLGGERGLDRPACGLVNGLGRLLGSGVQLGQLTSLLSRLLLQPVVDRTGLSGSYDIELSWTPDLLPHGSVPLGVPPIDPNGPSLTSALQEQLGLKLRSQRGPIDFLVIDHVERPNAD